MAGPGRMPNREVVEGALRILGGIDRSNITGMSDQDVLHVTNHVHQIGMLPTSRLNPRVAEAAQRGSGSAEQLVRNLLALVTSDSPVLPRSQRSETRPGGQLLASAPANQPDRATNRPNHTNMPSQEVLTNADPRTAMLRDALDMLTGIHELDLTAVAGRNTQNLIDHLQDIHSPPRDGLNAQVARAATRANGDPEQLVLNLLRLVTRKEPVLSLRATSSAQPPTLPSAEVIGDAVVLVARGTGMPQATEQNRRDVAGHLRDIVTQPFSSLHAGVRQAAQRWHDNPEQLANSLLTLVTANPPVLSNNPSSSTQSAGRHSPAADQRDRSNGAQTVQGPNHAASSSGAPRLNRLNAFNAGHDRRQFMNDSVTPSNDQARIDRAHPNRSRAHHPGNGSATLAHQSPFNVGHYPAELMGDPQDPNNDHTRIFSHRNNPRAPRS